MPPPQALKPRCRSGLLRRSRSASSPSSSNNNKKAAALFLAAAAVFAASLFASKAGVDAQARIQTAEPAAALLLVSESIINGVAEPPSYDACRLSSGSGAAAGSGSDASLAADVSSPPSAAALFPQPLPGATPLSAAAISKIKVDARWLSPGDAAGTPLSALSVSCSGISVLRGGAAAAAGSSSRNLTVFKGKVARDAAAKNCEPVWLEAAALKGSGKEKTAAAPSAVILRVTPAAGASWSLSLPLFVAPPPTAPASSSPAAAAAAALPAPRAAPRVSCAGPPGACALDSAPSCSSGVEARAGVGALSAKWQSVPGGCSPGGATADVSPAMPASGISGGSPLVYGLKATYFAPLGGLAGCGSGPRDLNSLSPPTTSSSSSSSSSFDNSTTFTRCQEGADFQAWGGDPFAGSPQLDPSKFGGCFGATMDGFVNIPKVETSQIEWRSSPTETSGSSSSSASSVESVTRRFRICARFTGRADVRLGALSLSPVDGGSGRAYPGDVSASVADATLVCQDVSNLSPGLAPLYVKYAAPPAGAAVLQLWVIPVAAAWRVSDPSDGLVVAGSGSGNGFSSPSDSSPWRVEFACSCCALFGDGSGGAGGSSGGGENGKKCCAPVDTCALRTWSDCGGGGSSSNSSPPPPPPPPETTQPPPPPETAAPPSLAPSPSPAATPSPPPPETTQPPPPETTQPPSPPPPPETTQPPPPPPTQETTPPPPKTTTPAAAVATPPPAKETPQPSESPAASTMPPPETTAPPPPETTTPPPPETTSPPPPAEEAAATPEPTPKRRTNVLNQGVLPPPRKTPEPTETPSPTEAPVETTAAAPPAPAPSPAPASTPAPAAPPAEAPAASPPAPAASPPAPASDCCLYPLQMSHPAAGSKEATLPVFSAAAAGGNASVAIVCDGATSSSALSQADVVVAVEGGDSGSGAAVAALAPFRLPDGDSASSSRSIWIATVSLPPLSPSSSSGVVSLDLATGAAGGLARARAPLSFRVSSASAAASSSPSSSSPPRGICGLVETTVAEVS